MHGTGQERQWLIDYLPEPLEIGQRLQFSCELFPDKVLDCIIEVKHVSNVGIGAKIIDLDVRRGDLIQVYLQEILAVGAKPRS